MRVLFEMDPEAAHAAPCPLSFGRISGTILVLSYLSIDQRDYGFYRFILFQSPIGIVSVRLFMELLLEHIQMAVIPFIHFLGKTEHIVAKENSERAAPHSVLAIVVTSMLDKGFFSLSSFKTPAPADRRAIGYPLNFILTTFERVLLLSVVYFSRYFLSISQTAVETIRITKGELPY